MASIPYRALQNTDSESCSLLSEAGECKNTSQYGTISVSTGSAPDLRLILLGEDESHKDCVCDIILRERAERTDPEMWLREGRVCGRKISVVKTPSPRKSDLASYFCFPRCKPMKIDQKYELEHCALQLFPGPHAFLLVTDNRKETWKEYLNTITDVFGEEASAYVVVVIIGGTELTGISSVNVCEISFLEDSDQSVQDLFRIIENMTQNKESPFFIQSSYKNAFLSWEMEKHAEIRRETEKLLKEKEEQHAKDIAGTIEDVVVNKEKHMKEREILKSFVIKLIGCHDVQPGVSCALENQLIKTLEEGSETDLRNILSSIYETLENNLKTSKETQSNLFDSFLHDANNRKKEIEDLKEEVEKLKEKESELEQKLLDRETPAIKQEEEDRDLPTGLKKLEEKTQHVTSGSEHDSSIESASPALFEEDVDRPLDEKAGEIKNRKEDSHNSGGFKLQRRGSINYDPPNMSEDQSGKED